MMRCLSCNQEALLYRPTDLTERDDRYSIPSSYSEICIRCANRYLKKECSCVTIEHLGIRAIDIQMDIWLDNGDVYFANGTAYVDKLGKHSYFIKFKDYSEWILNIMVKGDTMTGTGSKKYRQLAYEIIAKYEKTQL